MEPKRFRRAAALALVCLLLGATAVFADTVPADGDSVTPGNQGLVSLGEYAPGAIVTANVDFTLTCRGHRPRRRGQRHHDPALELQRAPQWHRLGDHHDDRSGARELDRRRLRLPLPGADTARQRPQRRHHAHADDARPGLHLHGHVRPRRRQRHDRHHGDHLRGRRRRPEHPAGPIPPGTDRGRGGERRRHGGDVHAPPRSMPRTIPSRPPSARRRRARSSRSARRRSPAP